MKSFAHINAASVDDAVALLTKYGKDAQVLSGGTDLVSGWKRRILATAPKVVVNLKTIPNFSYIKEDSEGLKIGALTTLAEVAANSTVKTKYGVLAQAAYAVASPNLRNMGTIAGNLCQEVRCTYYRARWNAFNCLRKGGAVCYLVQGDNTYGSIFGGPKGCYAVNNADTAPALIALNAKAKTNRRTIALEEFFTDLSPGHVLEPTEVLTEIQVPTPAAGTVGAFRKVAVRRSIDFSTVSVAVVVTKSGTSVTDARIILGAVAPKLIRAAAAEAALKGSAITETTATNAANQAVTGASPLSLNAYKVDLARNVVRRLLLSLA